MEKSLLLEPGVLLCTNTHALKMPLLPAPQGPLKIRYRTEEVQLSNQGAPENCGAIEQTEDSKGCRAEEWAWPGPGCPTCCRSHARVILTPSIGWVPYLINIRTPGILTKILGLSSQGQGQGRGTIRIGTLGLTLAIWQAPRALHFNPQ